MALGCHSRTEMAPSLARCSRGRCPCVAHGFGSPGRWCLGARGPAGPAVLEKAVRPAAGNGGRCHPHLLPAGSLGQGRAWAAAPALSRRPEQRKVPALFLQPPHSCHCRRKCRARAKARCSLGMGQSLGLPILLGRAQGSLWGTLEAVGVQLRGSRSTMSMGPEG